MRIAEAFKWLNQQAVAIAVLVLLLGVGTAAHRMAVERLKMTDGRLPLMDAANESRVRFIGYIDGHPWVVLPYVAVFAACLIWLQARQSPRWSLWFVFTVLAVPLLGYMWVCLRVGTEFLRIRSLE